jgi:FlaA1/EpsC-like NDP-sugar epimerase
LLKYRRQILLLFIDIVGCLLAVLMAYFITSGSDYYKTVIAVIAGKTYWTSIAFTTVLTTIIVNNLFRLYDTLWEHATVGELFKTIYSSLVANAFFLVIVLVLKPEIFYKMELAFLFGYTVYLFTSRSFFRIISSFSRPDKKSQGASNRRILIVGAGTAGSMVLTEIKSHPHLGQAVALIDDDETKQGSRIGDVRVEGRTKDIPDVCQALHIDQIVVSMPSASPRQIKEILDICTRTRCDLRIMPGLFELMNKQALLGQLREVRIEDLLGRDPIELDATSVANYIKGKVVMVTGGGGSIGSELCRQIAAYRPQRLVILDVYENSAYDLQQELKRKFPELNFDVVIASVRDRDRVDQIMARYRPHILFHAAAHKHVPLMEFNPMEAVKNNEFGTLNIAQSASIYGVKRFVMISTDKAVNPTNVMGATKRVAEIIVQAMDNVSDTEFVAVRFGNVLGSNGSVIPLFKRQIENGGPVTVTHPDIIRYFMTIPEAVQLVLQAGALAEGGEIFLLDMGDPVRIDDLARKLIRLSGYEPDKDINVVYTGLRPGEKLFEELLLAEEETKSTRISKIFIAKPSDIAFEELLEKLNELSRHDNHADRIRAILKKIVPNFTNGEENGD